MNDRARQMIAEFGRKYIWWKPVGDQPHSDDRIIAQTMNLGTYDDTLVLEDTVGRSRLVQIMLHAQPGWFSERSWEFWRGRLCYSTGAAIPDRPPRRSFHAATSRPVETSGVSAIPAAQGNDAMSTSDEVCRLATKLKAILDRAEAKDYRDIAAMISADVSLPAGLSAFRAMFDGEPAQVLRALGYFGDGDLRTLPLADQQLLRQARDQVGALPQVAVKSGSLTSRPPLQA